MKSLKTHTCPTCKFTDECDIMIIVEGEPQHHNCKQCGSTWRENGIGVVMSGGGEPK